MSSKHLSRNTQSNAAREFIKILEHIDYTRPLWAVFEDWIFMAAAAIHNRVVFDQSIEDAYLERARKYKPTALTSMAELLGLATAELVDNPQDFLGEVFEASLQTNANLGQFFTPWTISLLMAQMIMGTLETKPNRIITISEPACGAGGMVMAACAVLAGQGINYASHACIYAQDIDATCARMTYIQLSLSGAAAIVSCGDTLRLTCNWAWPTPAYVLNQVGERLATQRQMEAIYELLELDSQAVPEASSAVNQQIMPVSPDVELPAARSGARQLELFEVSA